LVPLVDQFEEVFTGASEAEPSLFIETLLDAASDSSGRISVVLTLRSDFLSATARYPALDAAVAACSELVPAMNEAELEEAISLPAAQAAKHASIPDPLDQGTVELLVRETLGREGEVLTAAFDPKGERVVTASGDKTARIWDARTGEPISKALQHQGSVLTAPAQIRASPIRALGSYLGCLTAKRALGHG